MVYTNILFYYNIFSKFRIWPLSKVEIWVPPDFGLNPRFSRYLGCLDCCCPAQYPDIEISGYLGLSRTALWGRGWCTGFSRGTIYFLVMFYGFTHGGGIYLLLRTPKVVKNI